MGHECRAWVVIDARERFFARALKNKDEILFTHGRPRKTVKEQKMPKSKCKHGHMAWSFQPSSQRYRCMLCNRSRKRALEAVSV
jgi:hypothetical protein